MPRLTQAGEMWWKCKECCSGAMLRFSCVEVVGVVAGYGAQKTGLGG